MSDAPGHSTCTSVRVCLSLCRCTRAQAELPHCGAPEQEKHTIQSFVTAVFSHGRLDLNGAMQSIFNNK